MTLLTLKGVDIEFPTRRGLVKAAKDVNLTVAPGEVLGVVGESGAGKSTIGNAIIDLLEPPGQVSAGEIWFKGRDLRQLDADAMRKVRGREVGMIFQDPQTSLNPLLTIGRQLIESVQNARPMREKEAEAEAIKLLESVGITEARARLNAYPHEFSGGMRQRVVIALALSGDPDLIIADEPTTALDVSIQKQILELIKALCRERDLGVILITHDIGVIAEVADRVAVMYRGRIVETGTTKQVIGAPEHEYTKSLISAVPRADQKLDRFASVDYIDGDTITRRIDVTTHWLGAAVPEKEVEAVKADNLELSFVLEKAFFKRNRRMLKAVDEVSIHIEPGETFGLVGESGSGKSTVARIIAGLHQQDAGAVAVLGTELTGRRNTPEQLSADQKLQMIFQDPYSSLNSRMRVVDIVAEPIRFYKLTESEADTRQIVEDLLDHVGLGGGAAQKYPHEFSGGQRQRISIARALAARPRILICDEPTSALDVSIQAQILNLLKDLQEELRLTMLFISHDLPVIRQMCDRVAVMKQGRLVEVAETEALFETPQHPYSRELIELMPRMDMLG